MSASEQIDQFIAENGGNVVNALEAAIVRAELAEAKIQYLKETEKILQQTIDGLIRVKNLESSEDFSNGDVDLEKDEICIVIYKPESLLGSQ